VGQGEAGDAPFEMFDADIARDGYVWDSTKLWAHRPDLDEAFTTLLSAGGGATGLIFRERAMLVIGQASTVGDSYCSARRSSRCRAGRHARPFGTRRRHLGTATCLIERALGRL
jgi:hypothetical protein